MSKLLKSVSLGYLGLSSTIGTYQGWNMFQEYKSNILSKNTGIGSKVGNVALGTFVFGLFSVVNATLWPLTYYCTKKINI
jgi:hypothetical protein